MTTSTPRAKSPRAVAQEALRPAHDALPPYSSARRRRDFTPHQLLAVLARETFFRTDYRGIAQLRTDSGDLRDDLGRTNVPDDPALRYAASRLPKKGWPSSSFSVPPRPQPIAA